MEISGKVIDLLEEKRGQGRNGEWRKRDFVIETADQYPKKVCIAMWGDKIDQFGLQVGEDVTVGVNIESREFNGKWYTDVKAWKLDKGIANQAGNANGAAPSAIPSPPMDVPNNNFALEADDDNKDLPF